MNKAGTFWGMMVEVEDATNHEHELKLLQAVRLYPKAVAWSVMMSTALVMDGYDLKVSPSHAAHVSF